MSAVKYFFKIAPYNVVFSLPHPLVPGGVGGVGGNELSFFFHALKIHYWSTSILLMHLFLLILRVEIL